jgi:hypothetical protein
MISVFKLHRLVGISERNSLVTASWLPMKHDTEDFHFVNREITVLFLVKRDQYSSTPITPAPALPFSL